MLRIVREARPRWVLCENVVRFIRLGLDAVLSDLRQKATPAGRPLYLLQPLGHRMKEKRSGLLPTVLTRNKTSQRARLAERPAARVVVARVTGWRTS